MEPSRRLAGAGPRGRNLRFNKLRNVLLDRFQGIEGIHIFWGASSLSVVRRPASLFLETPRQNGGSRLGNRLPADLFSSVSGLALRPGSGHWRPAIEGRCRWAGPRSRASSDRRPQ